MQQPQGPGPGQGPPPKKGPPGPPPPSQGLRLARYFVQYLRPVRGQMILLVAGTLLLALARLPMLFLPMWFTEHFDNRSVLLAYLGLVLAAMVVGWLLNLMNAYLSAEVGEALMRDLRFRSFSNLERVSMLAVYSRGPGEFVQQIGRDVFVIRDLFTDSFVRPAGEVAMGAAAYVSMLCLDPVFTLIFTAAFAAIFGLVRLANRQVTRYATRGRELMQEMLGSLVEYVGGFRDIVAAGRFARFAGQFDRLLAASQRVNVRTNLWAQASGLLPFMLFSLAGLTVYYVGLYRYESVRDVGTIITFAGLLAQTFPAISAVQRMSTGLAMGVPSMVALRQVLDQPPEVGKAEAVPLEGPVRSLRFDRVTLEIEGRRILNDLTFEIPVGKLTAIIGQSGSGKTTMFHTMLRLMEPTSGAILLNGRPLQAYTLESLREHVSFIPQTPFIFNQSLRENILLATPQEVRPEQLGRVVEMAQLGEVVARRQHEGGLEAVAGYMGNRLSGGEKQRVALARLLLRDPQVIVCDEYTANVDLHTARLIHEAVRAHFAGRTRVVITHELYSARGADWIVVIDRGRAVQQGTHDELKEQPGLYRDLLEVQRVE